MSSYDFAAALARCDALWQAPPPEEFDPALPHAELASKRHSNGFVNLSMMLTDPAELSRACGHLVRKAIAEHGHSSCNPLNADWVIGSATGGITICHEIAKWLDARCAFTEKEGDAMRLLRFAVPRGATVLIVEDVMTTGGTCIKTEQEMIRWQCEIIPLILTTTNRRKIRTLDMRSEKFFVSSLDLETNFEDWDPADCPYCKIGSQAISPKHEGSWSQFMQFSI